MSKTKVQRKQCLRCKIEFSTCYRGKYCSRSCGALAQVDRRRQLAFKKIHAGDTSLYVSQYKKYLVQTFGEQCMKCGWGERNPTSGKIPIELEHIDGNSNNNSLDNLQLLCPNCHSLTPTYKALNKGNGRWDRMNRYHSGKSH